MNRIAEKALVAVLGPVFEHPTVSSFAALAAVIVGLNNPLWVDKPGATHAVEAAGLTAVEVGGYRWLSCDRYDRFRTGFTAINAKGERVSGAVCSGFFKGNTLRFD